MIGHQQMLLDFRQVLEALRFALGRRAAWQATRETESRLAESATRYRGTRVSWPARPAGRSDETAKQRDVTPYRCTEQIVNQRREQHSAERQEIGGGQECSARSGRTAVLQVRLQRHVEQALVPPNKNSSPQATKNPTVLLASGAIMCGIRRKYCDGSDGDAQCAQGENTELRLALPTSVPPEYSRDRGPAPARRATGFSPPRYGCLLRRQTGRYSVAPVRESTRRRRSPRRLATEAGWTPWSRNSR